MDKINCMEWGRVEDGFEIEVSLLNLFVSIERFLVMIVIFIVIVIFFNIVL